VPKDTFFNLSEEKRTLICDVARDEFAEYTFDQASINRIVAKSGIAKGSFYQYFEDKSDLFSYLVQLGAQEKIKYVSPIMHKAGEQDIFTLLGEMFIAGIQFVKEHPKYDAISTKLLADKSAPIYQKTVADSISTASEFYEMLLENAIVRGEVRRDIDVKFFAHLITSMSTSIIEYYTEYLSHELDGSIMETVNKFIDFIRNGIGKNIEEV
jgi:AcrR family transcriptional regulator